MEYLNDGCFVVLTSIALLWLLRKGHNANHKQQSYVMLRYIMLRLHA